MAVFEGKNLSYSIIIDDTMSDDEVIASYVPPRYVFLFFLLTVRTSGDVTKLGLGFVNVRLMQLLLATLTFRN